MRTTAEVFDSHLLYTLDWDIESDIELNYAPHCYLISSYGVFFGRMGIRKAFAVLESQIPKPTSCTLQKLFTMKSLFLNGRQKQPIPI